MRFTRAIVRPPAASFAEGITSSGLGPPDLGVALEQHEAYCRSLERLGLSLARLPPDPGFPDSTFVEDAAIVTSRGAILTRPGAPSREGEVTAVGAALDRWFRELDRISPPGTVDGGDVCDAGEHFFIGLSQRTNEARAAQLAAWLAARGFGSSVIDIREIPGMLHLKTGLSWLGGRRLLAWREVAGHEALRGWEVVEVPKGEEYAANCVRVNNAVLVARGFPKTAARPGVPEDEWWTQLPVGGMVKGAEGRTAGRSHVIPSPCDSVIPTHGTKCHPERMREHAQSIEARACPEQSRRGGIGRIKVGYRTVEHDS